MYLNPSDDHVQYGKFVPPTSSSSNTKAPPKGIQFWVLLVLSTLTSLLYVSEVFISHAIIKEQHYLVDQHEESDSGPYYKDAWQKLAVQAWKGSAQDPTLIDLLKAEGISVHQGPPPASETGSTNAAPTAPATPAPAAPQPATP